MNIKFMTALLALSFSLSAQANEPPKIDGWTFLSGSDRYLEYGKSGSARLTNGTRIMLVQVVPSSGSSDQRVDYKKFTISDKDCKAGYGVVRFYSLSGELSSTVDYVQGGSSIAAGAADILCSVKFDQN